MKKLALAAVAAATLASVPANAATGNVDFNGSVSSTCVITVGNQGTLAPSTDFTVLGSEETGGSPGTASILATQGSTFNLTATAPGSFTTTATTGNDNVTFEANYQATTGDTIIGQTDGATPTTLNQGTTNVLVNMSGTKSSGTFEAGDYTGTVILTCQ